MSSPSHFHTNLATERQSDSAVDVRGCALCGSTTIRGLWQTFFLNTFFTVAQFFGSIIANSLALGADTGTMFADSITYLINIFAEFIRIRGASARTCTIIDLGASGVSIACLCAVTAVAMNESIGRLRTVGDDPGSGGGSDDDDVNPYVMFGFTFGNLLIDIGMIGSILLRNRGGWHGLLTCRACRARRPAVVLSSDDAGPSPGLLLAAAAQTSDGAPTTPAPELAPRAAAAELNVFSALAHVLADTMRTVTEMACSLIIWIDADLNGERVDAITAFVVCSIILLVAAFMLYEAIVVVRTELLTPRQRVRDSALFNSASTAPLPFSSLPPPEAVRGR